MPVVIIPLLASLIVGLLMFFLLGRPLAAVTSGLTNWLNSLTGASVILLGVILGLMMCFDLGGPVNKAAYAFATAGLSVTDVASLRIMAAVMAAGMVPPLAMALATTIRPGLFSEPERENGRAAWLLGALVHLRGRDPVRRGRPAAGDPVDDGRGAVTGALIMAFDVTLKAPHGGIFVFFAIGNLLWFLVALAAGTVVAAGDRHRGQTVHQPQVRGTGKRRPGRRLSRPCAKPPFGRDRSSRHLHSVEFDTPEGAPCTPRPSSWDRRSGCTPVRRRSSRKPL